MKNYEKLIEQMEQMKTMANEVISEAQKEAPDKIKIMDVACEDMENLLREIDATILRGD